MENITKWFGYPIYISKMNDYEKINKEILPILMKGAKKINSKYARTTDKKNEDLENISDNLHTNKKFKKLFVKIKQTIINFLNAQHYNLELFDIYITKSWATYSHKNQYIRQHRHFTSNFSFVYYVDANKQGNLFFEDDYQYKLGINIPKTNKYFKKYDDINYSRAEYMAVTGNVIIFPSVLFHETHPNKTDKPRVSISGDILLTMKKGLKSEHNMPSPITWKKI